MIITNTIIVTVMTIIIIIIISLYYYLATYNTLNNNINTAVLTDYFKSWRSYHLIIIRLREVHGLNRRYTTATACMHVHFNLT